MVEDQGHCAVGVGGEEIAPDVNAVGEGLLGAAKHHCGAVGPAEAEPTREEVIPCEQCEVENGARLSLILI